MSAVDIHFHASTMRSDPPDVLVAGAEVAALDRAISHILQPLGARFIADGLDGKGLRSLLCAWKLWARRNRIVAAAWRKFLLSAAGEVSPEVSHLMLERRWFFLSRSEMRVSISPDELRLEIEAIEDGIKALLQTFPDSFTLADLTPERRELLSGVWTLREERNILVEKAWNTWLKTWLEHRHNQDVRTGRY